MATEGVWVPEGGVYEIARALERLARSSGVELKTGEPVLEIRPGKVFTSEEQYTADAVVSGLDPERLSRLLEGGWKRPAGRLSCSGIAMYAAIRGELPARLSTHGVVLPSDPAALYASLEAVEEPDETMAFVDYYRPGEPYPNRGHVLALGLTAPANGREYGLEDAFVAREVERVSRVIGLPKPATEYFGEHEILHPRYFGAWGSAGGALYGAIKPFWMTGPLHRPRYSDRKRPWLWRVGASVHPGGGIPAVLGGAMISSSRLLGFLGK
jgi:phytoene dehydrogenase-like protein